MSNIYCSANYLNTVHIRMLAAIIAVPIAYYVYWCSTGCCRCRKQKPVRRELVDEFKDL